MTEVSIDFVTVVQYGNKTAYRRLHDENHPSVYFSTEKEPDDVYCWFRRNFGLGEIRFPKSRANAGIIVLELTIEKSPDFSQFRENYLSDEDPNASEEDIEDAFEDYLYGYQDDFFYHYHFFDPERALANAVRNQKGEELKAAMEEDIEHDVPNGRDEDEVTW